MNNSIGTSIVGRLYKEINKTKRSNGRRRRITSRDKIITMLISVIVVIFALACAYYYNAFINLGYNVEANLAQIDTQLQKRKNLIINLEKTVIDYSKHEREIFTILAELRSTAQGNNPKDVLKEGADEGAQEEQITAGIGLAGIDLSAALSKLMAVAEMYPDLKLSENFQTFMNAILEFENTIADLRMTYNSSINEYSTLKDQFPGYIFAALFRCKDYEYFKVNEDENNFIEVNY